MGDYRDDLITTGDPGIGRCLDRLGVRALVAAAVLGVMFFISGAAHATSLRSSLPAAGVIAPTTTTTVLTASPSSSAVKGTLVTLTATVTPAAPGTVQFKDGPNNLKVPVTLSSDGKAEGTITQLAVGQHQLSAVFLPSDPAAFSTSMVQIPFTVTAPGPTNTSTTLTTSSTSPIVQGSPVTLLARVTPPDAAGNVQFKDGAMTLGSPVPVSNGTASATTVISSVGTRQLTAVFTPNDPAAFTSSTSPQLSLTVIQSPQTVTSPAQASGQSLDGVTSLDGRSRTALDRGVLTDGRGGGLINLDLNLLGGRDDRISQTVVDGRGVTVLDGGNVNGGGLINLDLNLLGGRDDRISQTVVDGRGVTIIRDGDEGLLGRGGLLGDLLRDLL